MIPLAKYFIVILLTGALVACGSKKDSGAAHGGHESSESPVEYSEGKGLLFPEESKKSIGLEIAEVIDGKAAGNLLVRFQVFREAESGEDAKATTDLDSAAGKTFTGKSVFSLRSGAETFRGKIEGVRPQFLSGTEGVTVLLRIEDPKQTLRVGDFLQTEIADSSGSESSALIPSSALLRAATGTFVYVENGERLIRQEVKVGSVGVEHIQITEGLYSGDRIAVKPVEWLYLIELRAVKGGGHCH